MCTPSMPAPQPQRQALRAPDAGAIAGRQGDALRRKLGFAASIKTPAVMGTATTTGKTLLGS